MKRCYDFARQFAREEDGASALEYALLVILVAIVMAIGAVIFGEALANLFSRTGGAVDAVSPSSIVSPP